MSKCSATYHAFKLQYSKETNQEIIGKINDMLQKEHNMFLMIDLEVYIKGFIEDWKKDEGNRGVSMNYYDGEDMF